MRTVYGLSPRIYETHWGRLRKQTYGRNTGRPDCNLSRILMLLNTYTNYQPTTPYSKYFLYTDDLAISLQDKNFEEVKLKFERILSTFSAWYEYNSLKSKPAKLQVCTFLLCTNEAKRTWRENHNILELLWISLPYKHHCITTRQKGMYVQNWPLEEANRC